MATRNRFTELAQRIVLRAQEEAKNFNHDYVGPEHIILATLLSEGMGRRVLVNLGFTAESVRGFISSNYPPGDHVMLLGEIPFTPAAKKVLGDAVDAAKELGDDFVATEHIVIALSRVDGLTKLSAYFTSIGLSKQKIMDEVLNLRGYDKLVSKMGDLEESDAKYRRDRLVSFILNMVKYGASVPIIERAAENCDLQRPSDTLSNFAEVVADTVSGK